MATTAPDAPPNRQKRQRNQRGEGGRLREEVIDAAMRLLDRAPAAALSLRRVAKEAGVAAPSLYRQFADADAMMREIVVECWQQVGTQMAMAGDDAAGACPLERLREQMAAFVRYAMQRPSRYQLLFSATVGWEAESVGPLRPAYRAVLQTVEQHAAQGGRLPLPDPAATAILAISLAHGRIALAHLAPHRASNAAARVEEFVRVSLGRLFEPAGLYAGQPQANER